MKNNFVSNFRLTREENVLKYVKLLSSIFLFIFIFFIYFSHANQSGFLQEIKM